MAGDIGQAWVGVSPDMDGFAAKAQAGVAAGLAGVKSNVPVTIDQAKLLASVMDSASKLAVLQGMGKALSSQLSGMRADVNTTGALAKIAALEVRAASLNRSLASAGPNADPLRYEAQLLAVQAAAEKLATAEDTVTAATQRVSIVSGNWFSTLTRIGGTGVPLFAGALGQLVPALDHADSGIMKLAGHLVNTTNGWHLMTEAVVETLAIWGPAAIAATAFGLAAAPAVQDVYKQLVNMNTASQATGQQFQVLATKGQSVTAAVKPTVFEAFGVALNAVRSSSGTLAPTLASLGQAFDVLTAKAANALSSKAGGQFMQQASADLLALVQSFESVGSILGTLMKAVPGYAEVLLQFGNDALKAGAEVTAAIEPVLAVFLKLHGAVLYGGLAGTLAAKLFSGIVSGAESAALSVASLATKIGGEDNAIAKGALAAGGAIEELGAGPVVAGVGLVAGALAAVVLYLRASKDAAQSFNAQLEKTVQAASVMNLQGTLASALAQANAKVAQSYQQVTQAQNTASSSAGSVQFRYSGVTTAVQAATTASGEYLAGQQQLSAQQQNVNRNLAAIAATYGTSIPGALALASAAQVTSNQLVSSGAGNWAVMNTMLAGAVTQMGVFTPASGHLNAALNALTVTQSSTLASVQKVTQAYSTFIGIVTGGDSAFVTFEQGLGAVNAKLTGTSTAALAARSAFDSQIGAASTLYGNLSQLAAASGNTAAAQHQLYQAGKDMVGQLLPLATGSQEATAMVGALAQVVGFTGVPSFQNLTKWLGSTKGAEADLNNEQAQLTESSANLTQAAKNLAAAMQNEVSAGEASAIAKAASLAGIQAQLATVMENSTGVVTTQASTLAGQYYQALIRAGDSTTAAKDDVDAFITELGATPAAVAKVNAALASLPRQVNIAINVAENVSMTAGATAAQNAAAALLSPVGHAAGGIVRGGGAAGRDSVPAMLAPGELVIPASHAPKFADMARKASVPGFDAGGVAAPVFSTVSAPYSYASAAPPYVPPVAAGGSGLPLATQYQAATTNQLLAQVVALLQNQPYAYAQALNSASGQGARRAWFATAG